MEFSRPEYWSLSLLQRIFPTQGPNPSLWHCRWILYPMSYQDTSLPVEAKGAVIPKQWRYF